MYTAFYGLREKPFALLPDPRYLFLAEAHREALAMGLDEGDPVIRRVLVQRLEGMARDLVELSLSPTDQDLETYFAKHPEWFSEIKGKRTADRTQLCLTNPDVLRLAIRRRSTSANGTPPQVTNSSLFNDLPRTWKRQSRS